MATPVDGPSAPDQGIRTEMQRAWIAEERARLLIGSVRDYAIFMVSLEGLVETWNAGAERIKGYQAQEIIGQPLARFYTEEDRTAGRPGRLLRAAATHGRVEDEGWRVRKDGSLFWADVVISAVRDPEGHLIGYAKVTRDLTERRKAEAERLQLFQTQEALRQREEHERELQRTGQFRERLLGIVSHDLRNPLSAISLAAMTLLRASDLPARLHRPVQRILASSDRMSRMVEDLLDFTSSRLGEGIRIQPEPMDMAAVCKGVMEEMELAQPNASLVFEAGGDLKGSWDPGRVAQTVSNLIGNATRHGDPARPITTSLSGEEEQVVLKVHNFGTPIPAELLPYLFSPFRQGPAVPGHQREGLGLGLYIVEQIVRAHGGKVAVVSGPEEGTTFTVQWPRTPAVSPPG